MNEFLSLDFGLKEFGVLNEQDRLQRYRRYVYEAGAINRPDKGNAKVIDQKTLAKERKNNFKLTRTDRFKYKTRHFTDSGIIGTKEFVSTLYQQFKHYFYSTKEKQPKPISGLTGIYSLKKLTE